jgi:hypothetical protein
MTDLEPVAIPSPRDAGPAPEVQLLHSAGAVLHRGLEAYVHAQRIAGASWEAIAGLLGVTKQSAWRRWRYLDDLDVTLTVSGTAADGSRTALMRSEDTGAVVGREQAQQVALHGHITQHHPALMSA